MNDEAIGPKRSLTITNYNFHLCDRQMDRQTDNGHGTTAKTELTCSVSRLKPHQIVLT